MRSGYFTYKPVYGGAVILRKRKDSEYIDFVMMFKDQYYGLTHCLHFGTICPSLQLVAEIIIDKAIKDNWKLLNYIEGDIELWSL